MDAKRQERTEPPSKDGTETNQNSKEKMLERKISSESIQYNEELTTCSKKTNHKKRGTTIKKKYNASISENSRWTSVSDSENQLKKAEKEKLGQPAGAGAEIKFKAAYYANDFVNRTVKEQYGINVHSPRHKIERKGFLKDFGLEYDLNILLIDIYELYEIKYAKD